MAAVTESPSYTILGETVTMPVEIRSATTWVASYAVPFDAAAALIEYSGLRPKAALGNRALLSLAIVRYADGDLGPYHEFGVSVLVEPPASGSEVSPVGALIHQLPVNQPFTLAAGREIWGFPKWMARIDLDDGGAHTTCTLRDGDTFVLSLSVARGMPVPTRDTAIDAYSFLDGVLRRTSWDLDASGSRARPGGARIELGDHPVADELRSLGLPKRALAAMSVARVRMTFGPPTVCEVLRPS